MTSPRNDHQTEIVQLTQAAVEAAQLGQWDLVIRCYRDRGELLEAAGLSALQKAELLKLDGQVRDQAQTTQSVLTSLLGDVAATRHRLQGLRQRLGVPALAPESMSVEA
ncbi:MAG: hypothetical protein HC938_09165 [Nitrospira sp.]|nr:hypothetical protein [Nitrospira sp.]